MKNSINSVPKLANVDLSLLYNTKYIEKLYQQLPKQETEIDVK